MVKGNKSSMAPYAETSEPSIVSLASLFLLCQRTLSALFIWHMNQKNVLGTAIHSTPSTLAERPGVRAVCLHNSSTSEDGSDAIRKAMHTAYRSL